MKRGATHADEDCCRMISVSMLDVGRKRTRARSSAKSERKARSGSRTPASSLFLRLRCSIAARLSPRT